MAVRADSSLSYDEFGPGTGSIREDLSDLIELVAPTDTPFYTNIGRNTATAQKHEWQTQSLAAAALNAQNEGDAFTNTARATTTRVGNYIMHSHKVAEVSRSAQIANHAGKTSEMAFQMATKMKEIKRDVEVALVGNNASVAGSNTTTAAPELGGFQTWITSNRSLSTTNTAGGYGTTTGLTVARTLLADTQLVTFTLAHINTVMQSCFENGGRPSQMYLSPTLKKQFSTFTSIASNRRDVSGMDQAAIVGGADLFISDFGPLVVIPNALMTGSNLKDAALLVDPDLVNFIEFEGARQEELAKTADSDRRALTWRYTLEVCNEAGHGMIVNKKAA